MLFAQTPSVPQPDFWFEVLTNHGPAWAFIFGMLALFIISGRWLAGWLRPHADKLFAGHVVLVNTLADEIPKQRQAQQDTVRAYETIAKATEATAKATAATATMLEAQRAANGLIHETLSEGHSRLHDDVSSLRDEVGTLRETISDLRHRLKSNVPA